RMKSLGLIEVEQRAGGTILVTSLFGTRRTSYPAAPWATPDPAQATNPAQATSPSGPSAPATHPGAPEPPPPDPDAAIPHVEPTYYLPPRTPDAPPAHLDDDDPAMTQAEYEAKTHKLLQDGDPQA